MGFPFAPILINFGGGRSPDPPGSQAQRHVSHQGHRCLQGHQPGQFGCIIEKVPGAGTHRAYQRRQHPKGEGTPRRILADFAIDPDQPDRQDPLQDA